MTYINNLELYFQDREIRAKNNLPMQKGHQISYDDIVNRRGSSSFSTPCGGVVNDYVPFYFSPATSMAFTINRGNVELRHPNGQNLGRAFMDDIAFIVSNTQKIVEEQLDYYFTDIACNSGISPDYNDDITQLLNHVKWSLFDDTPKMGQIPEIGYEGVCKYFQDSERSINWHNRSKLRMAEFLVKDCFPMQHADCIILKNGAKEETVVQWIANAGLEIPVFVKPGCYF